MSANLFPVFLKLKGRQCLVVGAGKIAQAKIASLLDAGARVTVVAPQATADIKELAAGGRVRWTQRTFQPDDLHGMFLAIAATGDANVNTAVFREAERQGILCNSVDDPPHCDFYFPSIVRRGDLQVAISTAGQSPAFAQRFRKRLEKLLDPALGDWLAEIGALRREILAQDPPSGERTKLLHQIADRDPLGHSINQVIAFQNFSEPAFSGAAESNGSPVTGAAQRGIVYLVGAGPGNPELLTVRAAALLQTADFVLHDDLVPSAILALAGPETVVFSVGKRCGAKRVTQAEINARMADLARAGNSVVRLKSGDPLIFGRLAEELEGLRTANVPFEIVPGITAGFAAAASVGVPLTERRVSSRVILLSAHHAQGKEGAEAPDWRDVAQQDATLMIYMPGSNLGNLGGELIQAGLSADTPCIIVSRVSAPEQRHVYSTLNDLQHLPSIESPALLLVGRALESAVRRAQPAGAVTTLDLASLLGLEASAGTPRR